MDKENGLSGCELIKALYQLINTVKIHQNNNQLVKECVEQYRTVIYELLQYGDVDIQIWRGRFHIQGNRLRYRKDIFHIINELLDYFSVRELGGLRFPCTYQDYSSDNLITFVRLLNESAHYYNPADWLRNELEKNPQIQVEIFNKLKENPSDTDIRRRKMAKDTYFHAVSTIKDVADKASHGVAGVRRSRRLAQNIVDLVEEDSSLILGISTIKDYDDYTYTHSVNVALLATCLGRHIGLSEILLEQLAVCGLFHDLGKVGVSKDILHKPSKLDNTEWEEMQKHPLIGVRKILKLKAPAALRSRVILGPFEHHLNPDLSGYPKTHFIKKISLFGKILRIVDVYEALTSERDYRPRAFTPDEALRRMWSEAGINFDTALLKSFIHMMGIYPVGSIVELDSGEIGLVLDYPDESDIARPVVALLINDEKNGLAISDTINLTNQDTDQGTPGRNIVRGIHFSKLGIQPSRFFIGQALLTKDTA